MARFWFQLWPRMEELGFYSNVDFIIVHRIVTMINIHRQPKTPVVTSAVLC